MSKKDPLIMLTNDDGIESPGIWAAAKTLAGLGKVWVIAPREQSTSSGRSNPTSSDGIIQELTHLFEGEEWKGYAVGASPAQCVAYGILEILPEKPDLIVSGINYGSNTGVDITRSGTIGAALEAANYGIPSLAVSLQTGVEHTFSHSSGIDFSIAAYFTAMFAKVALFAPPTEDVQVLKIEVPEGASVKTPWEMTRLAPTSLYHFVIGQHRPWNEKGNLDWKMQEDYSVFPEGSDAHAVFVNKHVAVTPLSMDLTSRVNLSSLKENIESYL